MKIFQCGNCSHSLFFENLTCESCGHLSGYSDTEHKMLTFDAEDETLTSDRKQHEYKYCKNKQHNVCNWLLRADNKQDYCRACQHNRTIPNLSVKGNVAKWRNIEVAKHRVIYQLQQLGLSAPSKLVHDAGLCFDFVDQQEDKRLMTGHANGVVTILMREADSAVREKMKQQFREPYRTLIGHLRHEVGHYFWDRLVLPHPKKLEECRSIFGDERENYSEALQRYYETGAPDDWQTGYISQYATAHAWEDWAETWAHYLHIMDVVETAYYFKLSVDPVGPKQPMQARVEVNPYHVAEIDTIIDVCVPITYAVNSINRAMGLSDLYPFVISAPVRDKLEFIHKLMLPMRN